MLLLWLPAIHATSAAAKPHGWIPRPTWSGLAGCYSLGMFGAWLLGLAKLSANHPAWGVLLLSGIAMLVPILNKRTSGQSDAAYAYTNSYGREPLTFIARAFLIAPLIVFVLSHLVTPILIPRYVLPTLIAYVILLARFATRWLSPFAARKWLYSTVLFLTLATPLAGYRILQPILTRANDLEMAEVQAVPLDRGPMVVGNIINFMPLMRYSTPAQLQRYVYLLDWDAALKEYPAAVPDYHLMLAYRNNGYFPGRIQFPDEFLCAHRKFLVLDAPTAGLFDLAIRRNPRYQWSVVQVLDPLRYIFEVTQTSLPPSCPAAGH